MIGTPASFIVRRGGKTITLIAVPTPRPTAGPDQRTLDAPDWMLTAREIREEDLTKRYFRPQGCYVLGVVNQGNAAKSGLEEDDILTAVDGAEIASIADLRRAYAAAVARKASERLILVSVLRRGRPLKIALDYARSKAAEEDER
jgi:membrane-associated protease RseP (regulator of RpoE activity)